MDWLEAAARWYCLLLLVSVCWAPWIRLLGSRLPDRGASIVRPLALLGTVYPAWLLASTGLVPYVPALLWLTMLAAGLGGWGVLLRHRRVDRRWLLALLVSDVVSLLAFCGYLWLRGFTPEILHTEKPMDAAFLMSSSLTVTMPPPDPWFAGSPINYYYLGYLLQGSIARLAGVPGTTGFNLALATTFSLALTAAAGIGWNLARAWYSRRVAAVTAALAATMLMVIGNLYAAGQLLQTPAATLEAGWWDKGVGVGWRASRIVCDTARVANDCPGQFETINEFPAFSFILGDLHPHVLALPFAVTALALAFNLFMLRNGETALSRTDWARIGVTGAVIGSLYALNSWDIPTYLLVGAVAVWWGTGGAWRPVVVLLGCALVPWFPFYANYVTPTGAIAAYLPGPLPSIPLLPRLLGTIGMHTGERTSAGEFLTMFGFPYLIGLWLIGSGWLRGRGEQPRTPLSPLVAIAAVIAVALAILMPAPLIILCGIPFVIAIDQLVHHARRDARTVSTALFALGLLLVLGTEFVYIHDVFQSRMNTLFKFYYQVWTLFAVGAALGVAVIWREARPVRLLRPLLVGLTATGVVAGLVYPVLSARQWTGEFKDWVGLDGIAYVGEHSADELAAIRWLQENANPDDVLLEAAGCSYQVNGAIPSNRASAFSGVPTVVGWSNHERQWRGGSPEMLAEIPVRAADVAAIFADPKSPLAAEYGITLLYVGRYETGDWRHVCDVAGPYPGLDEPGYPGPGWEEVFVQGEVTIYRRPVDEASDLAGGA
jgi:YYY domain-containing protein